MDGLCSYIAHRMSSTLSCDYFRVGSILFSIVTRLKLYDEVIGMNEHIITYAIEIVKQETSVHIKRDELCEIVEFYKRNDMNYLHFNGRNINIPKVISTDKKECEVCQSSLTFYNDRKPFIATLYDQNDGSETVSL